MTCAVLNLLAHRLSNIFPTLEKWMLDESTMIKEGTLTAIQLKDVWFVTPTSMEERQVGVHVVDGRT